MSRFPDYQSAIRYLMGRVNYEIGSVPYGVDRLKLDRMARLLSMLGDPQDQMSVIHIAGTKGKGSTALMTASLLTGAGFRLGLYTSPHLERVEERFAVDGGLISESNFIRLVDRIASACDELDASGDGGATFFEITTALAWLHFAESRVDCAVIEVGMGGRLDSTNVCQPTSTAITTISRDHTKQLGDSLSAIAAEKAGILKPRKPVFVGPLQDASLETVLRIAEERQSPVRRWKHDFESTVRRSDQQGVVFDYHDRRSGQTIANIHLPLLGEHQAINAALAIALADAWLRTRSQSLNEDTVRRSLGNVACQARVELLHDRPRVIVDASHNEVSAQSLADVVANLATTGPRTLVFASSRDKDYLKILEILAPQFDRIIVTRFQNNPRGAEVDAICQRWNEQNATGLALESRETPMDAWRTARADMPEDGLICIAGSFFLAAELRTQLIAEFSETTNRERTES